MKMKWPRPNTGVKANIRRRSTIRPSGCTAGAGEPVVREGIFDSPANDTFERGRTTLAPARPEMVTFKRLGAWNVQLTACELSR
jgi:hypothetical protein